MAALIYHGLPDLNWAGFYFAKGGELVLGPFQGKPACVRIAWGNGVCGTAAARGESVVVSDVHEFPGHIACDPVSAIRTGGAADRDGRVTGVLDLDSPRLGRFDEDRPAARGSSRSFSAGDRTLNRRNCVRHVDDDRLRSA